MRVFSWPSRMELTLALALNADTVTYVASSKVSKVDTALDEVCAMSWRLSGR